MQINHVNIMDIHDLERHMAHAISLGKKALENNEFPVGCVLVHKNKVIATGMRKGTTRKYQSEINHAEILALRELEKKFPGMDKGKITLFSTMEPCLMCFGAILISGIGRVVWAYEDVMGGATSCDISSIAPLYKQRKMPVVSGILREKSLALFKAFFESPENKYWKGSLLATYTLNQPLQSPGPNPKISRLSEKGNDTKAR